MFNIVMHSSTTLASEEDVDTSPVTVKFKKYQQKAVFTIKIFHDDIVEENEIFAVKMTLSPSTEIRRGRLKYGHPKHTLVYIRDSKYGIIISEYSLSSRMVFNVNRFINVMSFYVESIVYATHIT